MDQSSESTFWLEMDQGNWIFLPLSRYKPSALSISRDIQLEDDE